MTFGRSLILGACSGACVLLLSGCVLGYGPCLILEPVNHSFTGHVHFRDFPETNGVDNVPLLVLDNTAYVYAPAESHRCVSANEVQLVGVSEFPDSVGENAHVKVEGSIFEAVSDRQHTRFLINVHRIEPLTPAH